MIPPMKENIGGFGKEGCVMKKTVWKRIVSATAMAAIAAVTLTACNSPEAAIRDDLTNQLETIKQGDIGKMTVQIIHGAHGFFHRGFGVPPAEFSPDLFCEGSHFRLETGIG